MQGTPTTPSCSPKFTFTFMFMCFFPTGSSRKYEFRSGERHRVVTVQCFTAEASKPRPAGPESMTEKRFNQVSGNVFYPVAQKTRLVYGPGGQGFDVPSLSSSCILSLSGGKNEDTACHQHFYAPLEVNKQLQSLLLFH